MFLTARICSSHFKEEDYERDLKNELLNLPTQKRLKSTAFPTLNLKVEHGTSKTCQTSQKRKVEQKREERAAKRARRSLVDEILTASEKPIEVPAIVLKKDAEVQVSDKDGKD